MKPNKRIKKYAKPLNLKIFNIKCEHKIRIKDKHSAIARAKYEEHKHGVPTHCYLCPKCLGYHLTTKESASDRLERIYKFKA